jgi:ATP-dependent RNA helicase DDX41
MISKDNKDIRSNYYIKPRQEKLDYLYNQENKDAEFNEEEITQLIKSSALLVGLENSMKYIERKIRSIAGWKFPKSFTKLNISQVMEIRKIYKIEVDGDDVPTPINNFNSMKFPKPILKALRKKEIFFPTPMQLQGLPVVLSGRDMIGISYTGTGKSLVFILPALMLALDEEMKMPVEEFDGPFAIIIVPSRELAVQLHETLNYFIKNLLKSKEDVKYPLIRCILCIGGIDIKFQIDDIHRGCHVVIGTPGRLSDLMDKGKLDTSMCKYLVLDEADRLLDMGFDEEVKKVLEKFKHPKQTLIFSSTMPKKIQEYAKKCLFKPIVINIGRAGSANLNVIQDVEFVKDESKLIQLLDTLQKTPPPVVIFCENKNDVDEINEYLLLKGIDVCSMHGDKDQEDRNQAIREFREGMKDVLVATDLVSKGLDFTNIEHVINFDMPKEIENYVLRIGRTGRLGKAGVCTTYVNKNQDEAILLDLKHLLIEAGQKIPPILSALQDEDPSIATQECSFCGGLGHKLTKCHKLENQRMKAILNKQSLSLTENLKVLGLNTQKSSSIYENIRSQFTKLIK